jgi:L-fuconolactonase
MNVDSHQHFWRYDPAAYPWMADDSHAPLRRDYLPPDLLPLIEAAGIQATVAVQASQTLAETEMLLDLSDEFDFIRGVVGWVDLRSHQVREQLSQYVLRKRFVGVRHIVHDEPDDRFMLQPDFLRGLAALAEFELTYDLLLRPQHLPAAIEVVRQFPRQRFVVDHIAKPLIKAGALAPWEAGLRELARFENVWCKVSGLVTEAAWRAWKPADFTPYLDVVFDCFGAGRLMFGSDWPVCTLAADYGQTVSLVRNYVRPLGSQVEAAVMGGNAVEFYELA